MRSILRKSSSCLIVESTKLFLIFIPSGCIYLVLELLVDDEGELDVESEEVSGRSEFNEGVTWNIVSE